LIEIAEVNKELHLSEIIECKLINNCVEMFIKQAIVLILMVKDKE